MRQGLFLVPPDTAQCNPESATRPRSPTARDSLCATPCSIGCCMRSKRAIPECGAAFSTSPVCRSRRNAGGKGSLSLRWSFLRSSWASRPRWTSSERTEKREYRRRGASPGPHWFPYCCMELLRKGWTGGGTRNRPLSHTRIMSHGPLTSFAAIGYNMLVWRD